MMKKHTIAKAISTTAIVAALFSSTSAFAYTITMGGTAVAGTGMHTNVSGAIENTFDVANTFGSYTGGAIVSGSVGNEYAAPPNDASKFITVGASASQPSPATLSIGFLADYFGYYAGSPDTYNALQLWNDGNLLVTFSGSFLAAAAGVSANGNQTIGLYWNIAADSASEFFNTVKFISTTNAFETDNHAVREAGGDGIGGEVPLPAAVWLFASALLGFSSFTSRRKG